MRDLLTIGRKRIGYLKAESPEGQSDRSKPVRTLLFLHAFPLNADMWQPQIAALPPGWRLIAPDYRGCGQSSLPDGTQTLDDYAGDVVDLLDALHIHDVAVAGCSMGGYVAFALLRSAPHYVSALMLVDTRAQADTEEGKASRRRMLEMIDRSGTEGVGQDMVPKLLGTSTRRTRQDLVNLVEQLIMGNPPQALKAAVTAMTARPDSTDLLKGLHLPAAIVAGDEDALIPLTAAQDLQRALSGSTLDIIPRAGHLPSLEQPAAFNAVLKKFFERL
jgi:pimeloyl-ACP methyl ester carboxylesterase